MGSTSITLLALIGISLFKRPPCGFFWLRSNVLPNPTGTFDDDLVLLAVDLQDLATVTFVGPGDHFDLVINAEKHGSDRSK